MPWVAVLVENDTYPHDVRVRDEAETLIAAGYRVTVVAPRAAGQARREVLAGVEVRRFWLPNTQQSLAGFVGEYVVAHLQLVRHTVALLAGGIDVLHVCNPPDSLGVLLVLARAFGRRTVFDNHDLFPELFSFRFDKPSVTRVLRWLQRAAFRWADVVVTTNESQREVVLRSVRRPADSVVVVRNGPRLESVGPFRGPTRPEHERSLELVFLGALEPQDGAVMLAEVVSRLVHEHGLSPRLTVVGEGSCRAMLASEGARLEVSDRIRFAGRVPHDEVPRWLANADICLDPAPCNELNDASTMMKIAEYMAARKPIVAFALTETRRTAGGAALYAQCGDPHEFTALVARLAAKPELRDYLAAKAGERLPRLVWERSADHLLAAYARLTGRKP